MKYQIGQVAKLLNISAQGIRLYEKEGIILPEREESGYRTYKRLDITSLLRARSYQKYGFSLNKIKCLINTNDLQYLTDEYENHEKILEKSILIQQLELNRLNYTKEIIKSYSHSDLCISYEMRPALYRLEYMKNDDLLFDLNDNKFKDWVSFAPLSFSSIRNEWDKLIQGNDDYYSGIAIKKSDVDKLECFDVFKECYYLEPVYCLTAIIQVEDCQKCTEYLSNIIQYVQENQLNVIGDIISESIVSYNKKENYTRIRKIWIPIKK